MPAPTPTAWSPAEAPPILNVLFVGPVMEVACRARETLYQKHAFYRGHSDLSSNRGDRRPLVVLRSATQLIFSLQHSAYCMDIVFRRKFTSIYRVVGIVNRKIGTMYVWWSLCFVDVLPCSHDQCSVTTWEDVYTASTSSPPYPPDGLSNNPPQFFRGELFSPEMRNNPPQFFRGELFCSPEMRFVQQSSPVLPRRAVLPGDAFSLFRCCFRDNRRPSPTRGVCWDGNGGLAYPHLRAGFGPVVCQIRSAVMSDQHDLRSPDVTVS